MFVMWNSIKNETTQQYRSYLCSYVCLAVFGANYNLEDVTQWMYRMIVKQPTSYVYQISFHKFLKIFVM